jgi:hypothetical protein
MAARRREARGKMDLEALNTQWNTRVKLDRGAGGDRAGVTTDVQIPTGWESLLTHVTIGMRLAELHGRRL